MNKKGFTPLETMKRQRKDMVSLKGFTLLEIIVAALILSLAMLGLANVFLIGKKFMAHTKNRMASGGIGRFIMDPISMQVRQDQWNNYTNCVNNTLCKSGNSTVTSSIVLNAINYTYTQTVSNLTGTNLRKVVTNITWTEPQQ